MLIHGLATARRIWDPGPGRRRAPPRGDAGCARLRRISARRPRVRDRGGRAADRRGGSRRVGCARRSTSAASLTAPAIAAVLAADRPRLVRRIVLVAPAGLTELPGRRPRRGDGGGSAAGGVLVLGPLTGLRWGRRLLLAFAAADGATIPPAQARLMVDASGRRAADFAGAEAIARGVTCVPCFGGRPRRSGLSGGTPDYGIHPRAPPRSRARGPARRARGDDRACRPRSHGGAARGVRERPYDAARGKLPEG